MADDIQSNIRINVDTTSAMDSIRLLQNQISAFHQQMSKMGAASVADSRNMQQNLINSINSTGQFAANITKIKTTAEQFSYSLEKNKLSMGEYFRYAGGATKTFGKLFAAEFDTINKVARERVKDLQSQYIKLGRDANGAMQAIRVRPLSLDMENLGTKTQIAAQRQQLLNQLLRQGSTNLLNFGKNTQWAGRQLMVGFTVPLSIMGGAAMKAYREIEEASLRLKRVYGDFATTAQETDKVVKQVQQLSLEYTKYGIAVKDTMEVAATAAATGKKGADLLAQIASANKLSALGGIDQQKALQTTISLTDAFSISAKDLGKNINFLNAVENQTVLSIDDLTTAIPKAAPVIQQLGGDVKDLAFFLTAMKEGGINASEGANAIKSGLASIINPTNTASKMLQGFGINLRGIVEANKGDVKKTVVDFAQALDTLDPINRAKAIEQLFGKFQFARMSTLFKNVIEQGSQASEVLKLANQSSLELSMLAQRELGKIEQSPLYKFQKAIADFQAQLAPVGEQFMKAVTPIINFGTDVLKQFNNLGDGVKGFIVQTVAVAGVIGPVLLMSFGLIANAVANVIKGFALVKDIFNKTGKSSMSLGDQVSYMTREQIQAAAIASSLDQVHSKLKQTFTSEAAAVDALTAAYQRSAAAQKAFNVPITPRTPRGPVRKYAAGGIISGPGTGTSDSILAMVSNGEAIIPAKSVARNPEMVRQLVSGNIPGFVDGIMPGIRPDKVRTYTDFTALLSNEANAALTSNAASRSGVIKEFRDNPAAIQGPLIASLAEELGGAKSQKQIDAFLRNNPNIIKYAGDLSNNIASELSTITTEKIGDRDLAPAVQRAIAKTPASKEMAAAIERLSTVPTTFEDDTRLRQRSDGRLMAIGREKLTNLRGRYTSIYNRGKTLANRLYPENTIVDPRAAHLTLNKDMSIDELEQQMAKSGVTLSPQAQAALSRKRRGVIQSPSGQEVAVTETVRLQAEARAAGKKIIANAEKAVAQGMAEEGQMRSPSRVTKQKGAQLVQGAVQGIQEGVDDARRAGSQLGQAAAQGVSQSGRVAGVGGRRVRQEEMAPHSVTGDLVPLSMINAPVQGPKPGTRLQRFRSGMNADSIYRRIQGADQDKLASGIRNKGFGASGALAVGSMVVPGEAGQMMGMASMLTSFGSMGAGGIAKGLKSLSPSMIKVGLQFTKMIPYVGAAVVAFEAFDTLIMPMFKKNAKAFEAVANTLNITQEKLDKVNNFFGTDLKLSGMRGAVVASGEQTKAQATIAQQFQKSQEFKDVYEQDAKEMSKLTKEQFTRAMQAMATDLAGQGLDPEGVIAIIDAIAISAGKTAVKVAPEQFLLNTPESKDLMNKNIQNIFNESSKNINALESQIDMNGAFSTFNNEDVRKALSGEYDNPYARPMFIDSETVSKLKASAAETASYISALSGQYQNGTITAKEYTLQYEKLIAASNQMPGDSGLQFLKSSIMLVNKELGFAIKNLSKLQASKVAFAVGLEVIATEEAYNTLEFGTKEQQAAQTVLFDKAAKEKIKLDQRVAKEEKALNGLQKQTGNIANQEGKINDKYEKRISQIEKIKKLNDQIAKSQQGQLTLAEALNSGDIAAAARASIDIQSNDIKNALDNQQDGLDAARKAELDTLKGAQQDNTAAIEDLTTKIEKIKNISVTVKTTSVGEPVGKIKNGNFGSDPLGYLGYAGSNLTPIGILGQFFKDPPNFLKNIFTNMIPPGKALAPDGTIIDQRPTTPVEIKANGGHIRGAGTGTSDDIPAMLSNGEYVIRANAVKTIGVDTLDKLNQADRIGFAAGGMVRAYKDGGAIMPNQFFEANPNIPKDKNGNEISLFDKNMNFKSAKAAEIYYTGLISSRRAGVSVIESTYQKNLKNRWMTAKESNTFRDSNLIDNRTYGMFNGLDQDEAKVFALALSKLYGKKGLVSKWAGLGLNERLLSNKRIPLSLAERKYWKLEDKYVPQLSVNAPKYANGGLVGYQDGGLVGSLFGDTQTWLNNLILSMFGSGGNPSAALNATSADAIKTGVKEGKNFTKDYIFDPTNPVDYAMAAIPGGKIVQGIGKGFNAAKGAVKGKIATMNAKKVLGIMGGKKARKLTPQVQVKMTSLGLEKFIGEDAYKTLHQGVKSAAGDSPDVRNLVEAATGMSKALKLKPGQSPAYGYLGTKEAVPYYGNSIYGNNSGQGAQQLFIDRFNKMINPYGRGQQLYGSTVLNLKPGALRDATVSFGDSLSIYQQAVKAGVKTPQVMKLGSLLTTLKLSSMARKTKGILGKDFEMPYAEIHMGSGFGLSSVSGIGVSNEFKDRVPEAIASVESMLAKAGKSGIPVHDIIGRGKGAFNKIGQNIPKPGKYFMGGMVGKYANGGMVRAAGGGMMSNGQIIGGYSMGGMVPKYFADGGYAMGTDTVPAMLTPGEFVIKKSAVDRIGTSALDRINNGYADGGIVGASSGGPTGEGIFAAEPSNSVYNNTYEINVNVRSESNPEEIARTVLSRIKQVDDQRVRGINGR